VNLIFPLLEGSVHMSKSNQFSPLLLARAVLLGLRGRIRFPGDRIGEIEQGAGEDFRIFRKMILLPSKDRARKPGATFVVQFRFARFGARTNRLLSLIPIPFIAAQPGFRSKTWMIGTKTGMFRGLYEWETVGDAEEYWESFPMRLMRNRAVPETLRHEIKET
jgi:hypothetical protein